MSEEIKRQVTAHLLEQQAAQDAREHAAKLAREAEEKKRQEALQRFLDVCSSTLEPAMDEFCGYLEGKGITGKVMKELEDRPNPRISFVFSSKELRMLSSVQFRHSGQGIEVTAKRGGSYVNQSEIVEHDLTQEDREIGRAHV